MTLTLAAVSYPDGPLMSARLCHDMRAALATIALHLETLERLAGPQGAKAASAAHGLISRSADMCGEILQEAAKSHVPSRRSGFDIVALIREVTDLLAPLAPKDFAFAVTAPGPVMVLGNPQETFRILFNLAHNAVMVARRTQHLTRVEFTVERAAATVVVEIADNGPGLPKPVRAKLFDRPTGRVDTGGFGLAIARELAERNGGTLEYAPAEPGTTFTLVLSALATVSVKESPVTRLLGRAAMRV